MTNPSSPPNPQISTETDGAVVAWMDSHGWRVAPARRYLDPDGGFHIWEEEARGAERSHALWISESMARRLPAHKLLEVLNGEDVANEIRISLKIRIQERGDEYRVSVVSRSSGEWKREE